MIHANDNQDWGPWRRDIDIAERLARFRCLRSLVKVLVGPGAAELVNVLRQAEANDDAAARASVMFEQLPALARRRVLSTYAALHAPQQEHAKKERTQ